MAKITKIESRQSGLIKRKKVAAYCRVSKDTEETKHSLSAQVSYYNAFIQNNPEWEFAGIYVDEGITGTGKRNRDGFSQLISDCEAGKINIVLTKSISRFARNTVDLLETVRHLKELGVEVRFQRENINSMSGDGELMLTILASFAQAEVEAMSQNMRWTIKKGFEQGRPHTYHPTLGYRWNDELKRLEIVPEEADVVRMIFNLYLSGYSLQNIVNELEKQGIKPMQAERFHVSTISKMLDNITYTGNLLLQKYYTKGTVNKKLTKNKGELDQYYAENTHEPIIDMEAFEAVQERKRRMRQVLGSESYETLQFSRKIVCGCCGRKYMRVHTVGNGHSYYYWKCWMKKDRGSKACASRSLREDKLEAICSSVLGHDSFDKDIFRERVEQIVVYDEYLEFHFADGRVEEVHDAKR